MIKTSKYSASVNQDLEIRVLDVLNHSEEALTIQQIQQQDLTLVHHTPQKMARVLGKLIDMGFVKKDKQRSTGRMMYKAVSIMLRQGYDVNEIYGTPQEIESSSEIVEMARIPNWEMFTERSI